MNPDLMTDYFLRMLPGLVMAVAYLMVIPRKAVILRLLGYIFIFLLIRDAMTPIGLWSFGTEGFFWLRFISDPSILYPLAFANFSVIGIVLLMNKLDPKLKSYLVYFKGSKFKGSIVGILGALVATAPLMIVYQFTDISQRGGDVPAALIPIILIGAVVFNFYEETLFRGYFQGYLETEIAMKPIKAALSSGIAFGFGHIFLATTVTNIGAPLLIYATYEGIIAGLVRMEYGLIPATLAHGLAIFILSSGII